MKIRATPTTALKTTARRAEILLPVVDLASISYACLVASFHDIRRKSQAKGHKEKGD
jgi:hypothetical protein